ncbi:MAG TPA: DUF2911 domain-containing protein [Mucilaginibacter sp.]|jgi:hypothetical protein|nr:DUF2911 domain-containing protein [Mucilaginibacter sp.]
MKTLFKLTALSFLVVAFFVPSAVRAQESPRESVNGSINGANVSIGYGSPSVRGRKIWGDLVPYGQIWRTGANPVTEIQTNKDLKIGDKTLPAGKYSIFTIPGENEWKVIFNSETGQWGIKDDGSANDDPSKDVLTVTVKPEKSPAFHEKLTFAISNGGFTLLWENLAVPVSAN